MSMTRSSRRCKLARRRCRLVGRGLLIAWVLVFSTIAGTAQAGDSTSSIQAFQSGEQLTFVLKWTIIPAGEAVLEVLPRELIDGTDAYHFVLTARSNAFVDAFYMVRDRIDAWSDLKMNRSLRYQKKQHEGSIRRDISVAFDWEAMTAQYTKDGEVQAPIPISAGTFDPLSIFYWSRSVDLVVGGRIERTVTDGKKHVLGAADVIRRERIKVPAGTFDTVLIEPDLAHVGGVFEKSPDAKIQLWMTADRRRLLVKLKSKVIVGSFSGELVRVTDTATLFNGTLPNP